MAAGNGSADYCAPAPSAPPKSQLMGEMVIFAAGQAQNPIDFWTQLYQAGMITQNDLRSMVETHYTEHVVPSPFLTPGGTG